MRTIWRMTSSKIFPDFSFYWCFCTYHILPRTCPMFGVPVKYSCSIALLHTGVSMHYISSHDYGAAGLSNIPYTVVTSMVCGLMPYQTTHMLQVQGWDEDCEWSRRKWNIFMNSSTEVRYHNKTTTSKFSIYSFMYRFGKYILSYRNIIIVEYVMYIGMAKGATYMWMLWRRELWKATRPL